MRVEIKPEMLRWARERAGVAPVALFKYFPKLEEWERGEGQPTFRQLESFANKTYTPFGYLFLTNPPEEKLPIPDFRTVQETRRGKPSPNLLETVQMMQRRQDWMREYLIDQGAGPLAFVNTAKVTDDPNDIARKIHETLGLTTDWARRETTWTDALRTLRAVVENAGIMIVFNGIVGNNTHRKLDVNEFRGFVLCDEYAPLIFVNNADVKAAQMFTIVHELAHVWLGQGGVFNLPDMHPGEHQTERFCNAVAAEFLIPEKELQDCWTDARKQNEPFQYLARYFKVSPLVAARRALDLGLINKTAFFEFYNAYLVDERRKASKTKGGGDFYANVEMRVGRRFAEAVIGAAKEGRLLYRDAFQLTGLKGETFDRYVKSFGARY